MKIKIDRQLNYGQLDNEESDMNEDLRLTEYHDKVANNKLTPEEKLAKDNLDTLKNMSLDKMFNGGLSELK